MAIFGNLESVKNQVNEKKFKKAFEYLEKVLQHGSEEYNRLYSLPMDAFEKVTLDTKNFALEQVYDSKNREACFFESHQQNIDVQFILEGEEIIEVSNCSSLTIDIPFNTSMDLIKYQSTNKSSKILLKAGDVAIFYPEDAHMPCVMNNETCKVIKTVVKVTV